MSIFPDLDSLIHSYLDSIVKTLHLNNKIGVKITITYRRGSKNQRYISVQT